MSSQATDQAEGLRRLLGRQIPRVVTLVSGGPRTGKTSAAINLAVALALAGRSVLLLDENTGRRNVAATLGIDGNRDLLDAVRGHCALEQSLVPGPEGLMILSAGKGLQALGSIDERGRRCLLEGFARIGAALDLILVDTAVGAASRLLPLSHPDQETILVASGNGGGQTEAYAMIKLMHGGLGNRRLNLMVSMVGSDDEGNAAWRNVSSVSQRYLGVGVDFLGSVAVDQKVNQASRMGRAAVEMFPGAVASVQFRRQAQRVLQWPGPREGGGGMDRFVQRLILGSRFRLGAAAQPVA